MLCASLLLAAAELWVSEHPTFGTPRICANLLLMLVVHMVQDIGGVAMGFRLFPKLLDLNGTFTVFSHFADKMPDFKQQLAAYRSSRS